MSRNDEIIRELDALTRDDREASHGQADDLLAESAPEEVRQAWERAAVRVGFWYA